MPGLGTDVISTVYFLGRKPEVEILNHFLIQILKIFLYKYNHFYHKLYIVVFTFEGEFEKEKE